MLFVCIILWGVPDILSVSEKNLKLFCLSWSRNLYSGVFPGIDILARMLCSISHRDFMISDVRSDNVYDFVVELSDVNCILNLDGNISHILPVKLNVIYMPFMLTVSDEYIMRENKPPDIILFLMGLHMYIFSVLNRGISIAAIIFSYLSVRVLYNRVIMCLYRWNSNVVMCLLLLIVMRRSYRICVK